MKNITQLQLALLLIFLGSCNTIDDVDINAVDEVPVELPALTAGSADFSTYVSLGNSLTAGFTDGALFKASQENSLPNILSQKFALVGSGGFTQPLTNDNFGGLASGGTRLSGFDPRLVFDGEGPVGLESLIGSVTVTTDIALNNPMGPFNNLGIPGAKSFHLLFDGYGNPANLILDPPTANPYYVRMAPNTSATVLGDALDQAPTFFSLWIGNNDVLGYALSGGDGSDPITPVSGPPGVGFESTYNTLIDALTLTAGAQGVVANIPDVTSVPHFTTVPHNPLDPTDDSFGPQIPTLNGIFGQLNEVYTFLNAPERTIEFSSTEASELVIKDETLTDLSVEITNILNASPTFPAFVMSFGLPAGAAPLVASLLGDTYGQTREATPKDLLVLSSSTVIGTVNTESVNALMYQGLPQDLAEQFSVEGITFPLEDKWVLLPSEQDEIASATAAFNTIIEDAASEAGLAFVDANALLSELASEGITSDSFTLTSDLVTGGAFSLDGFHPTSRGYALLANEFMKAIDATYGSNFEASGNLANIGNYPTNYSATLQ